MIKKKKKKKKVPSERERFRILTPRQQENVTLKDDRQTDRQTLRQTGKQTDRQRYLMFSTKSHKKVTFRRSEL